MASQFVHLHVHSEYSILDSACRIPSLLDRADSCGMTSLALTDHGVMSGVVKFYRQARRRHIKPILGCEVYVAPGHRSDRTAPAGQRYYHLVLLAETNTGYRNLLNIVSCAHTEGFYYRPRADKELLRRHADGLIALSACESGEIPRLLLAGRAEEAKRVAEDLRSMFGDDGFFIEIQHHGTERDSRVRSMLVDFARTHGYPLVATNDIHFLTAEDKLAHEVLLNVRGSKGLNDPDHFALEGEGYYFRTGEEMEALFADTPDAIENTARIAERCNVELEFGQAMMPPFPLPEGAADADTYLRTLAKEGALRRYGTIDETVRERLDYEVSVIERMNYSTYFLIVWDFVRFAKENGISVGPGRGSAAGSLVSYCLGITSVDPLKYRLIFERFLNPDRVSMPDFDIDFCVKGRDRVIDYVREKYGGSAWWDRIAQIATYDRMAARSVVRDVGRVLGVPYSVTDRVAKLIPFGWNLKAAVDGVVDLRTLYEQDQHIKQVVDIGLRLEGLIRNASTHAAGVVIAPDRLADHVPLLRLGEAEFVTQFDMVDVEAVGLLKFDFLGLRNLTLIDEAREMLKTRANVDICIESIPLDDEKTYALLCDGKTAGIFQLESSGMTNLIRRVQPDRFEDVVALLALYRPGPLESGMTDDYVERRQGTKPVTYPHPALQDVLEDTYGLPIYQDQVMLMAQHLAGFTLAEADILRKAMGKKNKEIMDSLRAKFIDGCLANGTSQEVAASTFADMEKFSRYGFNKSHTTAYAFVSYWTAYLKAHYPTHFMASLLTSIQGDSDRVAEYIGECRAMRIRVLPPDVNESDSGFTPVEDGTIRFGLAAVKHVGKNAISAILSARGDGAFESMFDLCRRVNEDGLDREAMEALIKAGAFDRFPGSRRGRLFHLSEGLELMQVARRERLTGQQSMFDSLDEPAAPSPIITEAEFETADLLAFEKELLGLYVTAHPLDEHRTTLRSHCFPLRQAGELAEGTTTTFGGRIKRLRRIDTKRGNPMAFVTLEDGDAEIEFTVFPRVLEVASDTLKEDALIGVAVTVNHRNGEAGFIADDVFPLHRVKEKASLALALTLDGVVLTPSVLEMVLGTLTEHPGKASVVLHVVDPSGAISIRAHERFSVEPSDPLLASLTTLHGVKSVALCNGNGS